MKREKENEEKWWVDRGEREEKWVMRDGTEERECWYETRREKGRMGQ